TGTASGTYVTLNTSSSAKFLGSVLLNNAGSGSNNFINLNRSGSCRFSGNIQVSSNAGRGIWFGELTGKAQLDSTKTISLASGFSVGELRLKNFIQKGDAAQNLVFTGTTAIIRIGTQSVWEGELRMKAPQLYLDGGTYFGKVTLEKTGSITNSSVGGNVFKQSSILTNSGTAPFILGKDFPDSASASLIVNNTGGSSIILASKTKGNWLGGKVTLNNELGNITVGDQAVSEITFADSVWINNRSANAVVIANAANSQVSFKGFLGLRNLLNANAASNNQIYVGNAGICRMSGLVTVSNTSQGSTSGIIFGNNALSRDTLTSIGQLEIGAEGFARGQLLIKNLAYLNPATMILNLSSAVIPDANTSILSVGSNCSFLGKVDFSSPQLILNSGIYRLGGFFTKTGTVNNSGGGNTYSAKAVFNLQGNAVWDIALNAPDRFKGEAEFNNFSTQLLRIGGASKGTIFEKKVVCNNTSSGSLTIA
ncbi:MAG: hypothetical protein V4714_02625, partial [Bacteroidota bacterium]